MSDTATTPGLTPPGSGSNAETEAALARLAAYQGSSTAGTERSGNAGALLLGLIFVVLLAAVGGLGWLQFAQMDELTAMRNDYTALQQQTAGSSNQFAALRDDQQQLGTTLQQQLSAANTGLAAQTERLAALEAELAGTRLRVNALSSGGSPLAEAEVLLRFARQRLLLARDTVTAIALFQAADELLRGIDDPQIFAIRDILAREVAQLQALPVVDVPGLFAQLSAQAALIDNFAVVSASAAQDFAVTPAAAAAPEEGGWWSRMKQSLSEYFVVTRSSEQIMPQLDTDEQYMIRALVHLHIEQAKLALLRAEPALYQTALEQALATSRQWLRSDDDGFNEFVAALATLRDMPIVTEIPAAEQTLAALRQLPGAAPVAVPDVPTGGTEAVVETPAATPEAQP